MNFFSKIRNWHHRVWHFSEYNRDQWVVQKAAQIPAKSRVLDVGVGRGQYRHLFAHCEYLTHDFAKEPSTIGKYTTLDFQSDITEIPVEDMSFDVILCTEVLEHVPEPIKALYEFARILRPGGRLLLTAPMGTYLHQEPYHFYGGYTSYWYCRFLNEAGFEIELLEPNQGFFSFFGQEAMRFNLYLDPRCTRQLCIGIRCVLSLLWIFTLPLRYLLPLLGVWLDRLALEKITTVGYHIVAVKRTFT